MQLLTKKLFAHIIENKYAPLYKFFAIDFF